MLQQELSKIWSGWKIDKLLGEGSFGKVYRIEREDFGHIYEAALKVITIPQNQSEVQTIMNDGMDEKSVTMYFRSIVEDIVEEFALMSQLKGNTNIVSYEDHAVIPHETGIGWNIYIRMELLSPLFDYLKENELSVRDVIRLGIDMCNALEICQKYNIIHRDIKPENMFVSKLGKFKLGDFGIARQLEKTSSGLSKKGTYTYMAPEVYKGEQYNSTVDIYSLGVVLYRFLNNNRTPFLPPYPQPIRYADKERANVMRMSGAKMEKPCNAEGRLAEIVLKACAFDPKERYESAVDMKKALEAVLYEEPEAPFIYPDGDTLPNDKPEYIIEEGTEEKVQEDAEKEVSKEATGTETKEESPVVEEDDSEGTAIINMNIKEDAQQDGEGTFYMFGGAQEYLKKQEEERLRKEAEEKAAKEAEERAKEAAKQAAKEAEAKKAKDAEEAAKKAKDAEKAEAKRKAQEEKERKKAEAEAKKKAAAEANPNGKRNMIIGIAAGAIVIGGIAVFMMTQKANESIVPNFANMTIEEAKGLASKEEYELTIVEAGSEYSDNVEKGDIISQNLAEGTVAKKGDEIEVIVSKGATTTVPSLVGKNSLDAEAEVVAAGLIYKVAEEQYSEDIKKGVVISQDIKEGETVEENQVISVVVSKGKELMEVPDVTGMTLAKAKEELKAVDLKVSSTEKYSSSVAEGKVISQSVKAGKDVEKGTKVELVVSKGEEPAPEPTYTPPSSSKPSSSKKNNSGGDSIDEWDLVN